MRCIRCGHAILPGQLRIQHQTPRLRLVLAERHIACPTERQVERARLWGRWT